MIWQRSRELTKYRPAIGPDGCAFMCLIYMLTELDPERHAACFQIIRLYDECVQKGWMASDCTILSWQDCADAYAPDAVEYLGHKPADYELKEDEIAIEYWEWGTHSHFIYHGYDPWPNSKTRRNGTVRSLRVFRIK